MHLYLIRHGQSIENTRTEWDGTNSNSQLTELGVAQAKAVAAWVAEHIKPDKLYASTLQRARQTAQAISAATQLDINFDNRIREIGTCYSDSTPFPDDALPLYRVGVWGSLEPYETIAEGGENWMQFRARIGGFIEERVREHADLPKDYKMAVVCHGGVIEGVFEHVFQLGPISRVYVHSNNTGITRLMYTPNKIYPAWGLHYHNRLEHLTPEQVT